VIMQTERHAIDALGELRPGQALRCAFGNARAVGRIDQAIGMRAFAAIADHQVRKETHAGVPVRVHVQPAFFNSAIRSTFKKPISVRSV